MQLRDVLTTVDESSGVAVFRLTAQNPSADTPRPPGRVFGVNAVWARTRSGPVGDDGHVRYGLEDAVGGGRLVNATIPTPALPGGTPGWSGSMGKR